MIHITEKSQCCGCTACYSVCPKQCISMLSDEEGFLYPEVDIKSCVNCGACEKVCPYQSKKDKKQEGTHSIYAGVQYKDEHKRLQSTAGGVFSLLADYILDKGGIVYAVCYENMVVCHKAVKDKSKLEDFRGSKYVQSTLHDVFKEVKMALHKGSVVLFVGTPCQIQGLKRYIGENRNLYTIDLLCLGVSSPKLFSNWIDYLEKKYKDTVTNVQFRNKHYGYSTPNVKVYFKKHRAMDQVYDTRVHANLFFRHYNVRPSCYECEFREQPRVSDFTIGDFTDIMKVDKTLDDDKGTTKCWIHTEKGRMLFDKVCDNARVRVISNEASNIIGGPKKQMDIPLKRQDFFKDAQQMDYLAFVTKWQPKTIKSEIAGMLRPVINCLPFKTILFKNIRMMKAKKYAEQVKKVNER